MGSGKQTGWLPWLRKWRWYHRDLSPLRRLSLHRELARRGSFGKMPLLGEPLEMLRGGRLVLGEGCVLEPLVWFTGGSEGRIILGEGVLLNVGVMVAALDLVEIGDHTMVANGSVITDSNHRFDDRSLPVTWQGFTSKGPTRIGANCWLGANVTVTSGVTIGERCVIGAGSVVTTDIPPFSIAAGVPARVIGAVPPPA